MARRHSSALRSFRQFAFLSGITLASLVTPALAATLEEEIDGVGIQAQHVQSTVGVGATITLDYRVRGGKVSKPPQLPAVAGLRQDGSGTNPQAGFEELTFFVTPVRAGDFTIPAFDIETDDGQVLRAQPIVIHAH